MKNRDISLSKVTVHFPVLEEGSAAVRLRAAAPVLNNGRKEAVLVDAALDDRQVLSGGAPAGSEIVEFGGARDGLAHLVRWSAMGEGYDALHLLCHGGPGRLQLGARTLDRAALADPEVRDSLAAVGLCVRAGGSVLLYGCHVAQGDEGEAFVSELQLALGVPVAASADAVGAAALGGAWRLAHADGAAAAAALAWPGYAHTLTLAQTTTTFSGIPTNSPYYKSQVPDTPEAGVATIVDIAGSGWDVEAKSSYAPGNVSFSVRGFNVSGYGDGDNTTLRFNANDIDYVIFRSNAKGFYFDLNQFSLRNSSYNAEFQLQALDANGGAKGNAVSFSLPPASGFASPYTQFSVAGNADFQQIYGFKLTFTTANDLPFFDRLIVDNIVVPSAGPTAMVTSATLSDDTGSSATDFITRTPEQTISGTLSGNLASGERVEVSYDNGLNWSDASSAVGSDTWSTTTTLSGSGSFQARVSNSGGSSTAYTHSYTLDTSVAAPSAPDLASASDSAVDNDDITSDATPTITGTAEADSTVTLYGSDGTTVLGTAVATGGNWSITPSSPLGDAVHNFTARAVDVAGNASLASMQLAVTIDRTAPSSLALSATSSSADNAASGATVATLSSNDATAVSYALAAGDGSNDADNGRFAVLNGILKVGDTPLAAGTYHVYLSATDAAGNVSYLPQSITVLDAPSVSSIVRADGANGGVAASASSVKYTVTFSESVTGVDASDFTLAASGSAAGHIAGVSGSGNTYTVTVGGLTGDGTLRLDLNGSGTGIESGGGIAIAGGYASGQAYTLDHTAPGAPGALDLASSSDSNVDNDNITSDATPTITGTAEAGSTVTLYGSDGSTVLGTAVATGGNWSITPSSPLGDAVHNLTARAVDAAGNESGASAQLAVTIDHTAPSSLVLSATSSAVNNASGGAAFATLSSTDATAVTYALAAGNGTNDADNARFTVSGGVLNVGGASLDAGTYHVYLSATDAAGNVSYAPQTLNVLAAPSIVSIVRGAGPNSSVAANADFVSYTVSFSESVTGVDESDFTLATTGSAGGHIASVSGSGNTYTVTVGNLGGDGALRLDLNGSGTGIESGAGVAIAGGYTSGQTYTLDHTAPNAPGALDLASASDSAVDNDNITSDTTPTITGTAEAGSTVTLYGSDGSTVLGTDVATGGTWSITASSPLGDAVHNLTARAVDAAGNQSVASTQLAVTIDSSAPSGVALSTTSVATIAAGSGAPVATLSSTDSTAVTYALAEGGDGIDADNAIFVVVGNTLQVGGAGLSAGTYRIYLSATDAAGNVSYLPQTITVLDAPSVTSIVRADGANGGVAAGATSVQYTVSFSDNVTGVDASDFTLATTGSASGQVTGVSGSGNTYTVMVGGLVGDGMLRLDLNGSGTGIESGAGVAIAGGYASGQAFTLDHTAPAAPGALDLASSSDSNVDNDNITNDTTPTITGTADDGSTVTLYGNDGSTVLGTDVATGGTWSIDASTLSAGSHALTAKAADAAGNVSTASSPLTVVIDTSAAAPAAPTLAADSDSGASNTDKTTRVAKPAIKGTAEAYAAITVFDTDGTTVLGTTTADAAGAWEIVSATLDHGIHTLKAQQVDLAGNQSLIGAGLTLNIDTQVPDAPGAPILDAASDSGTAGDKATNVARPVIRGTAEANALVRLYDTDGATLLGTATANGNGEWSLTSSSLSVGAHTLTAVQADLAGNVSAASVALVLTIETPPAPSGPSGPSAPPPTTIDGVAVSTQPVALPGGGSGTQVVVPVVTPGRAESTGNPTVADIPLATNASGALLQAQIPTGFGLTASGGASQPAGSSMEQLIRSIVAATPGHSATDQGHLTGNGTEFLGRLNSSVSLLVQTVVPTAPAQVSAPLVLTGTSDAGQHTALVIDTTGLPSGSQLVLNAVDFAAVIGAVSVTGNTRGQILTGDAASQTFSVAAGTGGLVFSGGGSDSLAFASTAPVPASAAGRASASTAPVSTVLHGGLAGDTAVFNGKQADYTIEQHDGYLSVTRIGQPNQQALVVNVESLQFADTSVTVENRAALSTIAGLYRDVLGRQADYQGFDSWGAAQKNGASLGKIALDIMMSKEAQDLHGWAFTGNAEHDVGLLYQGVFGRQSDAGGLAFWTDAMARGMGLEQVAQAFVDSVEGGVHLIGATNWDFLV